MCGRGIAVLSKNGGYKLGRLCRVFQVEEVSYEALQDTWLRLAQYEMIA